MNIFNREITTMLLPREKHKSWTPTEGRNKHIDSFFSTFLNLYNNSITNIQKNTEDNISTKQRTAIDKLTTNTNIVLKEEDKGGAITIINTSDYITDCALLLNDTLTYLITSSDITDNI